MTVHLELVIHPGDLVLHRLPRGMMIGTVGDVGDSDVLDQHVAVCSYAYRREV